MAKEYNSNNKGINYSIHAPWTGGIIAASLFIGAFNLFFVAVKLHPISKQAELYVACKVYRAPTTRNLASTNALKKIETITKLGKDAWRYC